VFAERSAAPRRQDFVRTMTRTDDILARSDAGEYPAAIASALGVSVGLVYSVLRQHRPGRQRKPRAPTSTKPAMIRALAAVGSSPARIVALLGISRQYVYRSLKGCRIDDAEV